MNRTNVGIIAKFASNCLKDNNEFVVATTHLLYNPRRDDVRIAQIQVLLAELDRLAVHSKSMESLPVIVTGDFNSEQFTPPYRLVVDGWVDAENLPIHMEIMDNCQHFNVATNTSRTKTKVSRDTDPNSIDIVYDLFCFVIFIRIIATSKRTPRKRQWKFIGFTEINHTANPTI